MTSPVEVITRRANRTAVRRWVAVKQVRGHEEDVLFAGLLLAILVTGFTMYRWPDQVLPVMMAPWILLSALFLPMRRLLAIYAVVALTVLLPAVGLGPPSRMNGLVLLGLAALMAILYVLAESRARLGIRGFTGESLLVDLRDRLESGSQVPDLPAGWNAQFAIKSANGEAFAGDFLVTTLSLDGSSLEVALVDVSGKGRQAGSRSLHLSGAFGGLLGSVPARSFLSLANSYLVRQGWDEGFATAVHVEINLTTGTYAVARGGHPPATIFRSGSGTWQIDGSTGGPLLGVLDEAEFPVSEGVLHHGDALLIYSDGVIESPGHDLIDGLDRMLGVATTALLRGSETVATEVVGSARSGFSDDRAAFVIRRS